MILMYMLCMIPLLICIIIMLISSLISKKSFMDRDKSSPFECGFEPKFNARIPFSLHFFLITVIFLIFDVEIALIFPLIMLMNMNNFLIWTITSISFMLILLIGIYHEWNQNMLNWTN
uniref:NADH-ubiquinone oxidoreductase chain 3 n=1 Tax=Phyllocnistis citrella TaxID=199020 RepID=A0A7M1LBP4_9NEOP|nr:NADH dehydrogenase subunit 3 [Phyllocnistis citrella]QOQ85857.1 NADH dehydrogenase subunit 3 [Phyllocnistis citrella]